VPLPTLALAAGVPPAAFAAGFFDEPQPANAAAAIVRPVTAHILLFLTGASPVVL
jgi:hypothetical protein